MGCFFHFMWNNSLEFLCMFLSKSLLSAVVLARVDWECTYLSNQIESFDQLKERLTMFMGQYNDSIRGAGMDLVFFQDAMTHLMKISRVIRMPRGKFILPGYNHSKSRGSQVFIFLWSTFVFTEIGNSQRLNVSYFLFACLAYFLLMCVSLIYFLFSLLPVSPLLLGPFPVSLLSVGWLPVQLLVKLPLVWFRTVSFNNSVQGTSCCDLVSRA